MYLLSDTVRQVLIGLTGAAVQISSELDVCEMSSDINNLSIYEEKASSVRLAHFDSKYGSYMHLTFYWLRDKINWLGDVQWLLLAIIVSDATNNMKWLLLNTMI